MCYRAAPKPSVQSESEEEDQSSVSEREVSRSPEIGREASQSDFTDSPIFDAPMPAVVSSPELDQFLDRKRYLHLITLLLFSQY